MKNNSTVVYTITADGETGEYGAIVWFGTKNRKGAVRKLHKLARELCDVSFKKVKAK